MISSWILFTYFLSVQCQQTSIAYNQPTNKVITAGKYYYSFTNPSCLTSTLSETCGLNGNTDTICSPKAGDLWKNGTWYPITWNPMYPSYVASPTLDVYIYFIRNYQNILVKKIININTSKGTVPVLVDNSWRLDSSAHTYDTMIYILPSDLDPDKELENRFSSDYPPPVYNRVERNVTWFILTVYLVCLHIIELALVPISTSLSITNTSQSSSSVTTTISSTLSNSRPTSVFTTSPTSSDNKKTSGKQQQQHQQQGEVQPWIIAVVVLACLAVLGACCLIFWVMRHGRKRSTVYGEKSHLELNSTASSSMFPEDRPPVLQTPPIESLPRPQSNASMSEPPFTSTDAILIADTFRQRMRRPEWQQQQQQQQQQKNNAKEDEEEKRRQLSEELLKKELEAEGTLMKKVGSKRAHLTIS